MAKTNTQNIPSPIGENKPRIDAREKVTGAAIFAEDIQFGSGLLHARIKRSPHPHARIKSIDASKAKALPGVKAVVSGKDMPSGEAPLIHPRLGEYEVASFILPEPGTNISNHFKIRKGDVENTWGQCAAIIERRYLIPHVPHVPPEPHIAVAQM